MYIYIYERCIKGRLLQYFLEWKRTRGYIVYQFAILETSTQFKISVSVNVKQPTTVSLEIVVLLKYYQPF